MGAVCETSALQSGLSITLTTPVPRFGHMALPKVIRQDWFTPLEGELGEPMVFQFRNMGM